MKRPKDMTAAELKALPIGPIEYQRRDITEADIAAGKCGRYIVTPIVRAVMVEPYRPDDIIAAPIEGRWWTFGRFADGAWFRQLSAL